MLHNTLSSTTFCQIAPIAISHSRIWTTHYFPRSIIDNTWDNNLLTIQTTKFGYHHSWNREEWKLCYKSLKCKPCHNTSSIFNLSVKRCGKKRWQLAYFLGNWLKFWHTIEKWKSELSYYYNSFVCYRVNFNHFFSPGNVKNKLILLKIRRVDCLNS